MSTRTSQSQTSANEKESARSAASGEGRDGCAENSAGAASLGVFLRRHRLSKGMTLRQMSVELGVSFPTISGWETGVNVPTPSLILPLSKMLGVDPMEVASLISPSAKPAVRSRTTAVEQAVRSITDDRKASYLFPTKTASEAVGCVPNKFADWWARSKDKLIALAIACPGETAAEFACIFAMAEVQRQLSRKESSHAPLFPASAKPL